MEQEEGILKYNHIVETDFRIKNTYNGQKNNHLSKSDL
jgi:hypothetical protein